MPKTRISSMGISGNTCTFILTLYGLVTRFFLFVVTSYVDMPVYIGFRDLFSTTQSDNSCFGGTLNSRIEPKTDMLLTRSS